MSLKSVVFIVNCGKKIVGKIILCCQQDFKGFFFDWRYSNYGRIKTKGTGKKGESKRKEERVKVNDRRIKERTEGLKCKRLVPLKVFLILKFRIVQGFRLGIICRKLLIHSSNNSNLFTRTRKTFKNCKNYRNTEEYRTIPRGNKFIEDVLIWFPSVGFK